MTETVQSVATTVATVDEAIMKALPFLSPFLGFIPGGTVIAAAEPIALEALTALDNAAKLVAAGNTGAAASGVLQTIIDHLTPGKPNAPILAG